MGKGAKPEDDFPRVVLAIMAALHAFPYRIDHQVRGRGAAGFEIPRIAAGAFARLEKHELEQPWTVESVVKIGLAHLGKTLLDVAGKAHSRQPRGQFLEALVGHCVQQTRMVREVAIDCHRGDSHGVGHFTHGHRFGPLLI